MSISALVVADEVLERVRQAPGMVGADLAMYEAKRSGRGKIVEALDRCRIVRLPLHHPFDRVELSEQDVLPSRVGGAEHVRGPLARAGVHHAAASAGAAGASGSSLASAR